MTAWDGLLEQLANCEKARFAAERAGEKGIQQAEAKITAVTEKLAEVQQEHQQQMEDLYASSQSQLIEAESKAQREVAIALEGAAVAQARLDGFEKRGKEAMDRARELEKYIRKLCQNIKKTEQDAERWQNETARATDDKVEMLLRSANQRVDDLSQTSREVQQAAADSMDMMQTQIKENISRADMRTESRSRYSEVCALSKMRGDLKMSSQEYELAKKDLMDSWQKEWSPVPASTTTPHSAGRFFSPLGAASHTEDFFMKPYASTSRPETAPPGMMNL